MNKCFIIIFIFSLSIASCSTDGGLDNYRVQDIRIFNSSFESVSEFDDFYIVPKGEYDSDHKLTTELKVDGGEGALQQAHFGLYASAAVGPGVIYNDKLSIIEVLDEETALKYIE